MAQRGLGFVAVVAWIALSGAAAGATERIAVKAGRIVPVAGAEIENGVILIEDGRIHSMGTDVEIPYDATVVDASDKVVFPGMIESHTAVGLDRPNENAAVAPFLDVADSLDPSSLFYEEALRSGVTTLGISQANNCVIGGMSRAIRPVGLTAPEMTVEAEIGLKMSVAPKTRSNRMIQMATLREAFRDLEAYLENLAEKKYEEKLKEEDKKIDVGPDEARKRGAELIEESDLDDKHRNLYRLSQGQIGAVVYCARAMDVAPAIALAEAHGFKDKMTLLLGSECYKAVDQIKALGRPVILSANLVHQERDPWTGEMKETFVPSVYDAAGVKFVLLSTPGSSYGEKYLWYQAARCVRNGISRQNALDAITRNAAEVLGLSGRVGSIEAGKDANLLVLSGDPLDSMTWVEKVMIEGTLVYDRDQDIRLKELLEGMTRDEMAESDGEGEGEDGGSAEEGEKPAEKKPEEEKGAGGSKQ